jgi:hypothetical protein
MIWRTKMQAKVQRKVNFKDSICMKWVQIGSYKFEVGPHLKWVSLHIKHSSIYMYIEVQ